PLARDRACAGLARSSFDGEGLGRYVTEAMRRILLWMAANRWLRYHLPRLGFARRAVLRFMPGEDSESALRAGRDFKKDGISVVFTRLGANSTRLEESADVAEPQLGLIELISAE